MLTADGDKRYDETDQHPEGLIGQNRVAVNPFLLNVNDEDLLREVDENISQGQTDMQASGTKTAGRVNEDYFLGDQLKRVDLYDWQQNSSVENRIFMSIETLIPLICANPGDPDIKSLFIPPLSSEQSDPQNVQLIQQYTQKQVSDYVDTLTSTILYAYDKEYDLSDKCKRLLRHWFIYRYGVLKGRYDNRDGKIHYDVVHPNNIILPGKNTAKGWIAEYKEDTLADLIILFPDAKQKILDNYLNNVSPGNMAKVMGTKMGYYEYWRDTFKVVKLDKIILEKIKNPYWDWDGVKKVVGQEIVGQTQNPDGTTSFQYKPVIDKIKYRILDRPRNPYFIFNYFRVNDNEYDDTGYIDQARALQDEVNKRKRQISQVAGDSGLLIASGDGIEKEEFDKYDGSPRSKLWVAQGNPLESINRLAPAQVSPGMVNDLSDSRSAMDTLLGTNDNTRGQTTPNETAAGRTMLRNADIGRLTPIIERFETFLQYVYEFDIQMRFLFQDEDIHVPSLAAASADDDQQNLVFNRDNALLVKVEETVIVEGVKTKEQFFKPIPITLIVKSGSTIPKDPATKRQNAQEDWKLGAISPKTYYEQAGISNPQENLDALIKWKLAPLSMASQKIQEELLPLILRPIRRLSETLKYETAPPDIKRQIEEQAGLKPSDGRNDNPKPTITETIAVNNLPPAAQTAALQEADILPEDISVQDEDYIRGEIVAAQEAQNTQPGQPGTPQPPNGQEPNQPPEQTLIPPAEGKPIT